MFDPYTLAFQIKYPWKQKPSTLWPEGYRDTFISIWHKDPCKDGSDDSCGWFKRAKHGDKEVLNKISKEFSFEYQYLFDEDGKLKFSVISTTLHLFRRATMAYFGNSWEKSDKFMRKNLYDIIEFAENPVDSIEHILSQRYGKRDKEDLVSNLSSIIYGWILRSELKWYQHPKWHIHHWRIQFHPWDSFKRRFMLKCCYCQKGFKKECVYGDWSGSKIWHEHCGNQGSIANEVVNE